MMPTRERLSVHVRRFDLAWLLVPLLGLVAVWPFLTQSLPSTDDGALHMLRLAEIDRCLRHGVLPLRWAPDFAHGYGYPFFNFYASLSSYIAEAWHLLGLDFARAIAAATISAFFAAGWGAYLLGRDLGGRKAGLVAATACMYAPYMFYDSAYRGNLAETWALALLPWVLWAGRRAALKDRWRTIVPLAALYAALVYAHNVYALISSPVIGGYLLLLWWRGGHRQRDALRLGTAIALGLALSAFFWLPAFFEKGWTRFSTGLVDYRTFFLDAGELLALPPQVDLSRLNPYPPRSLGWGAPILAAAGFGVWVWRRAHRSQAGRTGVPGARMGSAAVAPGAKAAPELEWAFFGAVLLAASFMTVRPSDLLWRTVPLLGFALIPWRYLGLAALGGGIAASALPALVGAGRRAPARPAPALAVTCAAIVLLVAAAVPWTYAEPFPQSGKVDVARIVGWEYKSGLIGTTAKNEYLPIWSQQLPSDPADPALLGEGDPIVARLDAASLPAGAEVVTAAYWLMRAELVIRTPQAFRAQYKQLYFPGWQVTIDGQPTTPIAIQPYGLLGFEVPAGEHRVVVRPVATPLRLAGTLVSGFGALAAVLLWIGPWRGRMRGKGDAAAGVPNAEPTEAWESPGYGVRQAGHPDCGDREARDAGGGVPQAEPAGAWESPGYGVGRAGRPGSGEEWSAGQWLCIALLALALLALKEGVIDRTENLFRAHRFDGERVPAAQVAARVDFGGVFTLRGYDLPSRPTAAGDPLRVDLYLSAQRQIEGSYMAYARLVDGDGRLWSLPYNGRPEGYRPPPGTSIWPPDAYGHWAYLVYTLPGTPPGEYWIQVGLFERDTWRGLNVLDERGWIAGLSTRIGPVQIARPKEPPAIDALDLDRVVQHEAALGLRYLGSIQGAQSVRAGEVLNLTLFWQAAGVPPADYAVRLVLAGGGRRMALGGGLPLGRREHLTSAWQPDEVVRSPHALRIPVNVQPGHYAIEAEVIDAGCPGAMACSGGWGCGGAWGCPRYGEAFAVGEIEVAPTDRLMAVPEDIAQRVDADLGGSVTLLGYDLAAGRVAAGETLPVTLYWQAQSEMDVSYKAFVQVVGPEGVVAQVDAVPVNWQRPTTGWIAGEVVVDAYALPIPADAPPGTYALIAGMYDETTLQRLAVRRAEMEGPLDHVALSEIEVRER